MIKLPVNANSRIWLNVLYGILCQAQGFNHLEVRVVRRIKGKFENEATVVKSNENGIDSVRFQIHVKGPEDQAIELEDAEFELVRRVFQTKNDWNGFQAEVACDIEDFLNAATPK